MDLVKTLHISAAGMDAEARRMRVIAENMANADSAAKTPGDLPYRRKLVTFENVLDRELGVNLVRIGRTRRDTSPFGKRYDPGHPAADANGYVRLTNVNGLIEMTDMREAMRSYEANLSVIQSARTMLRATIDLLSR